MANTIQMKRGLLASLPTLAAGEFGYCTDTDQIYIGDGAANHEVLMHDLFNAQTVLAATADNTPAAVTIAEQRVLGRLTGGNVAAITIGIADNNMLQVDGSPANLEFPQFTANGINGLSESEFKTAANLTIGTDVLAEQTIGIADNNLLEVDGSPNDNEFARFTAAGLEGLTGAETMAALSGQAAAAFSFGTELVTVGTPTGDTHAATKKYVDDLVSAGIFWVGAVLDKDTLAPPGGETLGDRYWIGGTGTGAWAGHDYDIAEYNGATWDYTTAQEGMAAYVDDENLFYFYTGSALAVLSSAGGDHAATHIDGGADAIDGDKLEITWTPTNYTRDSSTPSEASADDQMTAHLQGIDTALASIGPSDFLSLDDVDPSTYVGQGGKLVVVNSTPDGVEFVAMSSYLETTPTNGETDKAPNSDWAFDHDAAATGVHGAGANTLLHSGSTIDGGAFT